MTNKEEYVNALKARLQEYLDSIDRERKRVRGLLESIENNEQHVHQIHKLLEAEGVNLRDEGIKVGEEVSVVEIAYAVLSRKGDRKPVHYRDLAQLIFKEGKNIPGKDPAANLIAHLVRDDRFQRAGRGLYGLKDWGMKIQKRKRGKSKKKAKRPDESKNEEQN